MVVALSVLSIESVDYLENAKRERWVDMQGDAQSRCWTGNVWGVVDFVHRRESRKFMYKGQSGTKPGDDLETSLRERKSMAVVGDFVLRLQMCFRGSARSKDIRTLVYNYIPLR